MIHLKRNTAKIIRMRREMSHHKHSHHHGHRHGKETIPLVFLRHGQSTWNQQNIFIGMTDTPLTVDGVQEARIAGRLLASDPRIQGFDMVYSSLLRRATKTVWLALEELGWEWVPVIKDWRLNERSYGALVGRNKKQCVEQYGKDLVKKWRRSWDIPPPPMTRDSEFWPGQDPRYDALGLSLQNFPLSESLKDVTRRTSKFWDEVIVPQLKQKKRLMIVGHENNLRSIIKRLDNISDESIIHVELPRAIPLLYELDPDTLKPVKFDDHAYGDASFTPGKSSSTNVPLSGRYIFDKERLRLIAERDQKQVYDLAITSSLETVI
jgi:2,3-bisphosphoglycerate-dependent phosphoglycerate mutase